LFIIYGAIDVAITLILVETLVLVLFMVVIYHLPKFTNFSSKASRLRDAAVALLVGGFMTGLVLKAGQLNLNPKISDFYVENALPLAHGSNIVNVILVDFRALDTLGEITVLVIAAIGVVALLKLKKERKFNMKSYIIQLAAKRLLPVTLILSLLVFYRGHNEPGGGFIGGLDGSCRIYFLRHGIRYRRS
jgi:multicomponent Na+:H+ antiporter subunit A